MIPFNKPFLTGCELEYIKTAVEAGKISGNGVYTRKCHEFFRNRYGFESCFLTSSCTDALEMAAILCEIEPGDEVIIPSYTFVSTANAFVLRGARVVLADSGLLNPNIDPEQIEELITPKTKAIVVVHYAGIACDMEKLISIKKRHNLFLIEDAAQAIDSYHDLRPLGSFGDFATFSFHETKNIISGEGGMLVVNNKDYVNRAEIIWEKGTNRSAFFRGDIDKYNWMDIGSSFLPSDITAAFLFAQLEHLDTIQNKRKQLWRLYYSKLLELNEKIGLPQIPSYAKHNAHIFYIVLSGIEHRRFIIDFLKKRGINAVFHYLGLHNSDFISKNYSDIHTLPNTDKFADGLIRLPLHQFLSEEEINYIVDVIKSYFIKKLS
ncbi:MAG: dTDP-4-amino-4,6-dideoxygalactose transaminase [Flavobacteriales bacterium]|nr:dTDP-4-amino-4,6-dideoxygalactose transaminase [Flavobacteriales bacterium]